MERILVVDDDPIIIKLYQIILKKEGFEIDIASCGDECLRSLSKQKPDVILLDVILPDCSGLQLCNQIKNDANFVGIKIILVSGMEISPTKIAQGIETGADDYLVKPFDHKELLARVKNCCKLKNIEEALRDKNAELKDLTRHLQDVREEERKFFAREVQEELGQITAVLKMDIDWLAINLTEVPEAHKNRMTHASDLAKLIIITIRRIASSLRPSMIDELGLHASLDWKCKNFFTNHGINCDYEHTGDDQNLSIEIKTGLFRICQEILNIISEQSLATKVNVNIHIEENRILLFISDNSKGLTENERKSSIGLISIKERAASLHGEMKWVNDIGGGNAFTVVVPFL